MKQKLLLLYIITLTFSFISQAQWSLGDVAFAAYGAETATNTPSGPVDAFTIVLLRSVNSGEEISFTENGWFASGGFRTGENTITLTFTTNYVVGTQIIISADPFEARDEDGTLAGDLTGSALAIATGGDQIFAYDPANIPSASDESGFIAAIHMNGDWNTDSTSSTTSAQPSVFTDGVNSISIAPEVDNARVSLANCNNFSDIATLRTMLNTASNWETDNTIAYDQSSPVCDFKQTLSLEREQSQVFNTSLFPNPVQDKFRLAVANTTTIDKVEVYSISGKQLLTTKAYTSESLIDMSNATAGIYLVKIYVGKNILVKKLIKK